jgi:hypothetical protein
LENAFYVIIDKVQQAVAMPLKVQYREREKKTKLRRFH